MHSFEDVGGLFSVSRSNRHGLMNIVHGIKSIALIRMIPGAGLRLRRDDDAQDRATAAGQLDRDLWRHLHALRRHEVPASNCRSPLLQ